jgi:hypothetical protein
MAHSRQWGLARFGGRVDFGMWVVVHLQAVAELLQELGLAECLRYCLILLGGLFGTPGISLVSSQ